MNESSPEKIKVYTARWCAHSRSVEGFLKRNEIEVIKINIDENDIARQELIELNSGFASVPTLLFSDGSKLTEPSFYDIREKFGIEHPPGVADRVRKLLGRKNDN